MPPVAESSLEVKTDFPIFSRRFDGRPLIYLDSGATSQKPEVVIQAVSDHLRKHNANVHRGVYALAQEADAAYDGARRRVAAFVGAQPETTIFTKNVTEAINLVAYAVGSRERRARRRGADHADGAPREHRPLAGAVPRARRASCATWRSTSAARSRWTSSTRSSRAATCAWSRSRTSRTCSARSSRSPRSSRGRAPRARCRSWTAPRRCRTCRSTSRRSAPTSTPGPATRRSGRRGSACCTAAARSSREWSRS